MCLCQIVKYLYNFSISLILSLYLKILKISQDSKIRYMFTMLAECSVLESTWDNYANQSLQLFSSAENVNIENTLV